jgi:histidine ammonia-lyase
MTLNQVLADSLAATTAAGGHPEPFKNDKTKTTMIVQALIVYAGLSEIAVATAANLQALINELMLIRDAIHRS